MTPGPTIRRIDDPDEEGPDVRLAEQRDVPSIAATLTIALADSRWTRWALPDDGRMQRLTRLHELDAGHRGVATRTAWVTDDVAAVAVWEPPPGAEGTSPLPADVRAALVKAVASAAADPEFQAQAVKFYAPLRFLAPAQFDAVIREADVGFRQLWKELPWGENK